MPPAKKTMCFGSCFCRRYSPLGSSKGENSPAKRGNDDDDSERVLYQYLMILSLLLWLSWVSSSISPYCLFVIVIVMTRIGTIPYCQMVIINMVQYVWMVIAVEMITTECLYIKNQPWLGMVRFLGNLLWDSINFGENWFCWGEGCFPSKASSTVWKSKNNIIGQTVE